MLQGVFISVQIIQQGSILFNPNSLDYPSVWLDSYFTFLALPQLFQLWVSCVSWEVHRVCVWRILLLLLSDFFFNLFVRFNWVSAVVCIFFFRIVLWRPKATVIWFWDWKRLMIFSIQKRTTLTWKHVAMGFKKCVQALYSAQSSYMCAPVHVHIYTNTGTTCIHVCTGEGPSGTCTQ